MKVTRSYWLGLGSGLIISAILTIVFSPLLGQIVPTDSTTDVGVQQAAAPNPTPSDPVNPPVAVQPTQVNESSDQSTVPQVRPFVIPVGANAVRIADLLVAQGFLEDKESFLLGARHLRVERRFRAGTFNLSMGLTPEELLHQLVKK